MRCRQQVPLDRVLIETDSPYLALCTFMVKPTNRRHVPYVAKVPGDVYDKSIEEDGTTTLQNFENL